MTSQSSFRRDALPFVAMFENKGHIKCKFEFKFAPSNQHDVMDQGTGDVYAITPVNDNKCCEVLPSQTIPSPYAFFRYLGFRIEHTQTPQRVLKHRMVSLTLTITLAHSDAQPMIMNTRHVFKNGMYYFQNVELSEFGHGVYHFDVTASFHDASNDSKKKPTPKISITSYVHDLAVSSKARLEHIPELLLSMPDSLYGPLRQLTLELELENFHSFAYTSQVAKTRCGHLRCIDARYWLKNYALRVGRIKAAQRRSCVVARRPEHARKSARPCRSGSPAEHEMYFGMSLKKRRAQAQLKKLVRLGQVRMFHLEPLAANSSIMLYHTRDLYRQLASYGKQHPLV